MKKNKSYWSCEVSWHPTKIYAKGGWGIRGLLLPWTFTSRNLGLSAGVWVLEQLVLLEYEDLQLKKSNTKNPQLKCEPPETAMKTFKEVAKQSPNFVKLYDPDEESPQIQFIRRRKEFIISNRDTGSANVGGTKIAKTQFQQQDEQGGVVPVDPKFEEALVYATPKSLAKLKKQYSELMDPSVSGFVEFDDHPVSSPGQFVFCAWHDVFPTLI